MEYDDRLGNDDDQSTADNDLVRCAGYVAVVAEGFLRLRLGVTKRTNATSTRCRGTLRRPKRRRLT